jgi:hypothetical protein
MTDVLTNNIEQLAASQLPLNGSEMQVDSAPEQNQLPIYLLIVVGQTLSKQEKTFVLDRINSSKINLRILVFFFILFIY